MFPTTNNQPESNPLNLLTEDLIALREVSHELPGQVNVSTVWRWAKRGLGGITLETVKIGGRMFTSRQSVTRFIERTSRN